MPAPTLTAGDRVEWLHVAAAGRAFVVSTRAGKIRRTSGAVVFVVQDDGRSIRLRVADVVRTEEAIRPK